MAAAHLVSVDEYLHSSFEYDAEYVEGRIVQRPMPRKPHSKIQQFLQKRLDEVAYAAGYRIWPDQRVRTQANPPRYRIPDVCVTLGEPAEDVFTEPPVLCIEILSPDDSAFDLRRKIDEYLSWGVHWVWVVEPVSLTGEIYTASWIERVRDGRFRAGEIEIDLSESEQPNP